MTSPHDSYLELCAAQAVGALDAAERAQLQEHLRTGCAECLEALRAYAAASVAIGASVPEVAPPEWLKGRILAEIRSQPGSGRTPPAVAARFPMAWLAAAAVLLVAAGAGWFLYLRADDALREERSWTATAASAGAMVVDFVLTEKGPAGARGRATYDPATRRAILSFENLRTPSGRDFEAWTIRADGDAQVPRSLGLVRPDASGRAVLRLEGVETVGVLRAFAVSLEPAGGSPNKAAPSGYVVMLGGL